MNEGGGDKIDHLSAKATGAVFPGIIFAGSTADSVFPSVFLLNNALATSSATSSRLMDPHEEKSSVRTAACGGERRTPVQYRGRGVSSRTGV